MTCSNKKATLTKCKETMLNVKEIILDNNGIVVKWIMSDGTEVINKLNKPEAIY